MDKKKRLSDDIAEMLLSMIVVEKKYLPGDKLPNEIELSKELGVSRITLREAIRILVTRHVLEIKEEKELLLEKIMIIKLLKSSIFLRKLKWEQMIFTKSV